MTPAGRPGWLHPPVDIALVPLAAVSLVSLATVSLVALAAVSLVSLATPAAASAQSGSTAGVVAGYVANEQAWDPEAEAEPVGGLVLGAYISATTPKSWLSVLAEGAYVQRGGDVVGGEQGVEGAVRADYLSINVRPRIGLAAGPVRVSLAAGPAIDVLIRSRIASGFQALLRDEGTTVFGVMAGVGLDAGIGAGRTVGLEGRLFEGLSDAYSGDFVSLRNRSWEVVARFAVAFER